MEDTRPYAMLCFKSKRKGVTSMSWLQRWEPNDDQFWKETGSPIAWKTLIITTVSLILSFSTWFVVSALVVRLPQIGFKFDNNQLFWLAAMPGLAGGTLRMIHTFVVPIFGTRMVIGVANFLKIIPCVGLAIAVMNPETSWGMFMLLAFLAGFGGGDFSSFMPSTSMFFPKRLQGAALGIQAGVGNFGVSLTQFVTPWIIGFAAFGAVAGGPQLFTKADQIKEVVAVKEGNIVKDITITNPDLAAVLVVTKDATGVKDVTKQESEATKNFTVTVKKDEAGAVVDVVVKKVVKKDIWLQNGLLWYVPLLVIFGIASFIWLRSIPIKASFAQQLDIFGNKHTWIMTILYLMTFGSFSGLAAAFPMMIKAIYGGFQGAPDPLKYAFYGPLIGASSRVIFGFISDKTGGAIITTLCGLGVIVFSFLIMPSLTPTGVEQFPTFYWFMFAIFFFSGIGNASTFRQIPIIFEPRQAGGVLGFTGAVAAYGPFIFSMLISLSISSTGNAKNFFWGLIVFCAIGTLLNWWYYNRKGAEVPC